MIIAVMTAHNNSSMGWNNHILLFMSRLHKFTGSCLYQTCWENEATASESVRWGPFGTHLRVQPEDQGKHGMFESLQDKSAQTAQSYSDSGVSGQQVGNDADKRVRFNQEIFSGTMSIQAEKAKQKERDQLRNRPGATMWDSPPECSPSKMMWLCKQSWI